MRFLAGVIVGAIAMIAVELIGALWIAYDIDHSTS